MKTPGIIGGIALESLDGGSRAPSRDVLLSRLRRHYLASSDPAAAGLDPPDDR